MIEKISGYHLNYQQKELIKTMIGFFGDGKSDGELLKKCIKSKKSGFINILQKYHVGHETVRTFSARS